MELLSQACLVVPNSAHDGVYGDAYFRTLATPPYAKGAMDRFFRHLQPQLIHCLREHPFFHNGGNVLRLEHLMRNNYTMFQACLEDARNSIKSPFVTDIWQLAVIQRHQPVWGYARPRFFVKILSQRLTFQ